MKCTKKNMPHGASLLRVERLIMHSMSSVYAYDVVYDRPFSGR